MKGHDFKTAKNGYALEKSSIHGNHTARQRVRQKPYVQRRILVGLCGTEDILDWYSDIDAQYTALYADTEHHQAIKNTIDSEYA